MAHELTMKQSIEEDGKRKKTIRLKSTPIQDEESDKSEETWKMT